ncbi:MAG: DUF4388 domain-containing protein [Thermogemmatispora sp.]|uniref:DUF4388 domain-containing protein n=1 Tax=Thermogemmatispora sp. TaxID=1968838 RepID=UPI00261E94C4|nr:DUF4388 domain-containing protein [Thermogemmatispora sp.]MBX5455942.1 DUF4388 domain-containing protein [Thermogemmatispora sp.]
MSTVSFATTLDRVNLADLLRRLEAHEKSGVLIVKQGALWVELYFSQGRLLCIGPVRAQLTLGDRLVQAGVISQAALSSAMTVLRERGEEPGETRIALILMELGYATREQLRAWAAREASRVLEVLLSWRSGEVYFEEGRTPPPSRLLVSLSPSALLPASPAHSAPAPSLQLAQNQGSSSGSEPVPAPAAAYPGSLPPSQVPYEQPLLSQPLPPLSQSQPPQLAAQGPGQISQQLAPTPQPRVTQALPETGAAPQRQERARLDLSSLFDPDALARLSAVASDASSSTAPANAAEMASAQRQPAGQQQAAPTSGALANLPAPRPIMTPYTPRRVDVSFIHPEVKLIPPDLQALRSGSVEIPLTPDEWRVFGCITGETTPLQIAQRLGMPLEQVYVVIGELMALGLIQHPYSMQPQYPVQEFSPAALPPMADPYAAQSQMSGSSPWMPAQAQAWSAPPQTPQVTGAFAPTAPAVPQSPIYVETESQWGNGGNGARFIVGRGWGVQPTRPLSPGSPAQPPYPASVPVGGSQPGR